MSDFLDYFDKNYYEKLDRRAGTFRALFEFLDKKDKSFYSIIETGCVRGINNYVGDGMSTVLFDKFVNFRGGEVISVDIDSNSCKLAQSLVSDKTKVVCADSVQFLWKLKPSTVVDLLYLDSFDIDFNNPHPSMLHHIKELCAIIGKLSKGTLIVVDDNIKISGKGRYIEDFMNNLGYNKIIDSYQVGWVL